MDIINQLLSAPTVKYLDLTSYLVYIMLALHLFYMGMVLGSSVLSVIYARKDPHLSSTYIHLGTSSVYVWLLLGILPPAGLAFLYKMIFYATPIPIHLYMLRLLGIGAVGFILLSLYSTFHPSKAQKPTALGTAVSGATSGA